MQVDENYCKKFGLLKKAAVLSYYDRVNEAFNEIAKAVAIIKEQKLFDSARNDAIQKRWRFKLGLDDGFELPFPIEKVHPDDIDKKMLSTVDAGAGIPMSTIRMYIEHVSPFRFEEHSKNAYLNECIEELYLDLEFRIQGKIDTIATMKKHVERLDELADLQEMFGEGEMDPS